MHGIKVLLKAQTFIILLARSKNFICYKLIAESNCTENHQMTLKEGNKTFKLLYSLGEYFNAKYYLFIAYTNRYGVINVS